MMSDKPKHAGGRPTIYSLEYAKYICDVISKSDVGLRQMCRDNPDMPNLSTIYDWIANNSQFSELYMNSRYKQSHILASQVKDIAEETHDYIFQDEKGAKRIDSGILSMQNMRIKANTWLASRVNPKDYGDTKQVEELQADNERYRQELNKLKEELDAKNKKEYWFSIYAFHAVK